MPIGTGTAITAGDLLVGDDRRGVDNGGGGGDGLPSMGGQIGAINPGRDGTVPRFHGLDQEVDVERANDDVSHLAPDPIGSGSTGSDDDSDSSDDTDDSLGATDAE